MDNSHNNHRLKGIPEALLKNFDAYNILEPQKLDTAPTSRDNVPILPNITEPDLVTLYEDIFVTPQQVEKNKPVLNIINNDISVTELNTNINKTEKKPLSLGEILGFESEPKVLSKKTSYTFETDEDLIDVLLLGKQNIPRTNPVATKSENTSVNLDFNKHETQFSSKNLTYDKDASPFTFEKSVNLHNFSNHKLETLSNINNMWTNDPSPSKYENINVDFHWNNKDASQLKSDTPFKSDELYANLDHFLNYKEQSTRKINYLTPSKHDLDFFKDELPKRRKFPEFENHFDTENRSANNTNDDYNPITLDSNSITKTVTQQFSKLNMGWSPESSRLSPDINMTTEKDVVLLATMRKDPKLFNKKRIVTCDAKKANYTKGPDLYEKSKILPQILKRLEERQKALEVTMRVQKKLLLDTGSVKSYSVKTFNGDLTLKNVKIDFPLHTTSYGPKQPLNGQGLNNLNPSLIFENIAKPKTVEVKNGLDLETFKSYPEKLVNIDLTLRKDIDSTPVTEKASPNQGPNEFKPMVLSEDHNKERLRHWKASVKFRDFVLNGE